MCLARPRFPVHFSLWGFLRQVFSGHPGTLTCSLILPLIHFSTIIKVVYGVTPRPYPIFSSICWLFSILVFLLTFGKCRSILYLIILM